MYRIEIVELHIVLGYHKTNSNISLWNMGFEKKL
jgi:hypothetical protein